MMQPLQIWLPRLGPSIKRPEIGRDAMRAFELWRDELVVWTLPEIREAARWRSGGIGHLAIPSEEFDQIDIVHVTDDGRVYTPTAENMTPRAVEGLLDAWLNVDKDGGIGFVRPPESITVAAPYLSGAGEISWRKRTIAFDPGAYMPMASFDRGARKMTMNWPPPGSPATVSPEAESALRFPSKRLESDPPLVITDKGDKALQVFLRWPGRLGSIMPLLSGLDDMFAQAEMAKLARQSSSDLPGALRAAQVEAQPYLHRGHSTVEHAWFRPTLQRKGLKHVLFKAEDWGLTVPPRSRQRWDEKALNEALKQDAWQKWLAEPVTIRRAWGAAGLFWTLLLDRLEAQRSFVACERCGRIIGGKEGKRFCGKGDDRDCFRARRAVDQRRSRQARARD